VGAILGAVNHARRAASPPTQMTAPTTTAAATPTDLPVILRIEQSLLEWRTLANAVRHAELSVAPATAIVLNHFRRVLTQVTRTSASDPAAVGALVLTRRQWRHIGIAAREAGAVLDDRRVPHTPARAEYRRELETMARCLVSFADELTTATEHTSATVWRIRCAERRAVPHRPPRREHTSPEARP